MNTRKYYRTVIQLEVLSEEPIGYKTMGDLDYEINEGHCSGVYKTITQDEIVSGKKMAELLIEQGSDTEFFMLDEDGNYIDDE